VIVGQRQPGAAPGVLVRRRTATALGGRAGEAGVAVGSGRSAPRGVLSEHASWSGFARRECRPRCVLREHVEWRGPWDRGRGRHLHHPYPAAVDVRPSLRNPVESIG